MRASENLWGSRDQPNQEPAFVGYLLTIRDSIHPFSRVGLSLLTKDQCKGENRSYENRSSNHLARARMLERICGGERATELRAGLVAATCRRIRDSTHPFRHVGLSLLTQDHQGKGENRLYENRSSSHLVRARMLQRPLEGERAGLMAATC